MFVVASFEEIPYFFLRLFFLLKRINDDIFNRKTSSTNGNIDCKKCVIEVGNDVTLSFDEVVNETKGKRFSILYAIRFGPTNRNSSIVQRIFPLICNLLIS